MLCCFFPQPCQWLSVSLASTIPYPHIMFDIPFVHLIPNMPRQSADDLGKIVPWSTTQFVVFCQCEISLRGPGCRRANLQLLACRCIIRGKLQH